MLSPTNFKTESALREAPVEADVLLEQLVETCVSDLPEAMQALRPLGFQVLDPFEAVDQQFSLQGVTFEGAIALVPSNPRFIEQSGQKVLMPTAKSQRRHQLQIQLQPMVTQIGISGRSTQPISLEVLDAEGAIVTVQNGVMCSLPKALRHDTSRLPSQVFKLAPPTGGCLRLSAKVPFVLATVAV